MLNHLREIQILPLFFDSNHACDVIFARAQCPRQRDRPHDHALKALAE